MATALIGISGGPDDGISGRPGDEPAPQVELRTAGGRRPSFILGGIALVLAAALTGAMLVRSSSSTVGALILAQDLRRGQTLTGSHLRVVEIRTAPGLRWVAPEEQDRIIGGVATGPFVAGQLVAVEMFASRSAAVGQGNVVVAAALRVGDVPVSVLPGDRVRLHRVEPMFGEPSGAGDPVTGTHPIGEAVVWSVASASSGDMVLALLVDESLESVVSQSAAAGSLKVNLLGDGG